MKADCRARCVIVCLMPVQYQLPNNTLFYICSSEWEVVFVSGETVVVYNRQVYVLAISNDSMLEFISKKRLCGWISLNMAAVYFSKPLG